MVQGYCVKDRKMVEMKDPKQITLKNGRPAVQGTCPECGTKVTKIGGGGGGANGGSGEGGGGKGGGK